MNSPLKKITILCISFIFVSCSDSDQLKSTPNDENQIFNQNDGGQIQKIQKLPPSFKMTEGSTSVEVQNYHVPLCQVINASGMFVWAEIVDYSFTQIPFSIRNSSGEVTRDLGNNISECVGVDPSFKITLKIENHYTNSLDSSILNPPSEITLHLNKFSLLDPEPLPRFNRQSVESEPMQWNPSNCSRCEPLKVGDHVGVFVDKSSELDTWYLSENVFWSPSIISENDDYYRYFSELFAISSLEEMELMVKKCNDYNVENEEEKKNYEQYLLLRKKSENKEIYYHTSLPQCWR